MRERSEYVCDAAGLIDLWMHFGPEAIRALRELVEEEALKLPEGVVREILRQSDKLKKFIQEIRKKVEVKVGPGTRVSLEVSRLEKLYGDRIRYGKLEYPGFWHSKAGKHAADGQVVAVAKVFRATAVSDDRAVRLACSLEGVACIGFAEFWRRIGLVEQPNLFDT
jgi:hypothetical protein